MLIRRSVPASIGMKALASIAGAAALAVPFLALSFAVRAVAAAAPPQSQENAPASSTPDDLEQKRTEQRQPRTAMTLNPEQFDKFVGFYQLHPDAFFTVTRKEGHYFARLTGQDDVEWFPESPDKKNSGRRSSGGTGAWGNSKAWCFCMSVSGAGIFMT